MDDSGEDLLIEEPALERIYTSREKALRDFYIDEYLVDYDEVGAAVRVGYPKSIAKEYATRLMSEPYVLREIRRREGDVQTASEDPEVSKKRIIAGLNREANYCGPGSSQAARVAALSRLATLHGMDPSNKPKDDNKDPAEGAFVVPGVMTPEQWEQVAAKQQEELVNGTPVMPAPPSIN